MATLAPFLFDLQDTRPAVSQIVECLRRFVQRRKKDFKVSLIILEFRLICARSQRLASRIIQRIVKTGHR